MNLQHERISLLCEALSLPGVAQGYGAAAQQAAKTDTSYSDFLEGLLKEEAAGRRGQNASGHRPGLPGSTGVYQNALYVGR